jgi:hypothetical protein
MAHAADPVPPGINITKIHGGFGYPRMSHLNLSCLEQQGVTGADVKAALERNDTASLMTWRNACGQSPPGITGNARQLQQQKIRTGTVTSGRNATNVCPASNLLAQSIITGMTPGSSGCNITHKPPAADSTLFRHEPRPDVTIMRHALNGSDAGQKMGAYMNRNTSTIKPFPDKNRRSYHGEMPGGLRSGSAHAVNGNLPDTTNNLT